VNAVEETARRCKIFREGAAVSVFLHVPTGYFDAKARAHKSVATARRPDHSAPMTKAVRHLEPVIVPQGRGSARRRLGLARDRGDDLFAGFGRLSI